MDKDTPSRGKSKGISRRSILGGASAGLLAGAVAPLGRISIAQAAVSKPPSADVFMTKDISHRGIMAVFERVAASIGGKVAIKLHVGDPGNRNFLSPDLVRGLCAHVKATLVDSNVFYGGPRQETDTHRAVAREHGFDFADYDVLDQDGAVELPIVGGRHLQTARMGRNILNYDSIIVLSHFKGHGMAGYGGAIKNLAMGIAAKDGKGLIHGGRKWSLDSEQTRLFLERLVEYGKGIADARKGKIAYINVLNNLSIACDCVSNAPPASMPDIGIVASTDIVAVERASFDLVYQQARSKDHELVRQIESKQGIRQIEYAEELGMGTSVYSLIDV